MSELLSLGEVVRPNRPRVKPESMPDAPFIGMEHVEAHTMKLLGTVPASTMKSSAVHFKPGDVLYGRLRPYLNKAVPLNTSNKAKLSLIQFTGFTPISRSRNVPPP